MWFPRPVYESMPYLYMGLGVVLLSAAWWVSAGHWPTVFMTGGALSLTAGLVLWLRRRDYRTRQVQYNKRSLDE